METILFPLVISLGLGFGPTALAGPPEMHVVVDHSAEDAREAKSHEREAQRHFAAARASFQRAEMFKRSGQLSRAALEQKMNGDREVDAARRARAR